jgi:hypothetical protein
LAQEDADAVRLAKEETDAFIAVRLAQEEADAVRMAQEDADAVDAARSAQEDADAARALELEHCRTIIRQSVNNSPSTLPLYNPSNNPINPFPSTTVAAPVGVVRQPGIINCVDLMTKGNAFLLEHNIQRKINSASAILCQQPEINFSASDIVELNVSKSQLYEALEMMMSDSTVVAVKTANSSNVNVMTTKAPPSFHGVITSGEVDNLVKYSNLLGMEYVNLRSLVDKAAISTIDMHLSAEGTLCGLKKTHRL